MNSQNLQLMADEARKAEDTIEAAKQAEKVLEATQMQIKNAQGVLALTNFEIEKATKELQKVKSEISKTMKTEKDKLASVQLQRQSAEKEFGEFLVSVKEEKSALETANNEYAKKLEKLEDSKRTNQALIDEKKGYIKEAKKEAENLERTRVRAEADINGMKNLERDIIAKDEALKVQEESVKTSQLAVDRRNNELNQREQGIQLKEAQLAAREARCIEGEAKFAEKNKILEERETYLVKLEEGLKTKGIELPKTEPKDDGGKTESWEPKKIAGKKGGKKGGKKK